MARFRNPVLVLGGGYNGLWIARTLGRYGIDVYLAVDRKEPAIFSRYCKGSFAAPGVTSNRETIRGLLRKVGKSLGRRPVVYTTTDLNTLIASELKNDLPDDFHFVVGDKECVEIMVRKNKFYKALERFGIDFPITYFPEDSEDVRRIGAEVSYPVFIRPAVTQLFNQVLPRLPVAARTKGFVAYSLKELTRYYRLAVRYGIEVMFQEIIPGAPSNSYQLEGYYDLDHRPTVFLARQRLRIWPPNFGNTTLCVSIPLARLAEQNGMINEFIKVIGYSGLMSAEFKKDPRDGMLKIFEINARPWWHFWLSTRCGVDILFLSYLDAIGEEFQYSREYEIGVRSIILLDDLRAATNMFLDGNLGLREWVSSLMGKRTFALLKRDDMFPFIVECMTRGVRDLRQIDRSFVAELLGRKLGH